MSRNTRIAPEPERALVHLPSTETTRPPNDREAAIEEHDLTEVDEEVTLTMHADETRRLIESAFGEVVPDRPSTDDEITLNCQSPVASPSSNRLKALRVAETHPPPSSRPPPLTAFALLAKLLADLEEGRITQEEMEERLAEMAHARA
jgi:hypothetical protein